MTTHSVCVWELETQALTDIWRFDTAQPATDIKHRASSDKAI